MFTQGEWKSKQGCVFAGEKRILWGTASDVHLAEMDGNLQLAASALALYEALKYLVDRCTAEIERYARCEIASIDWAEVLNEAERKARQALRQAEGKETE